MSKLEIPHINPSILSADFANLASELEAIKTADAAHVDVMDNHFVPNLTMGPPIVERIKAVSPIPLDIHLMIENPDKWAPAYAEMGAESVTFHYEAAKDYRALAKTLRSLGAKSAIALKPDTSADVILHDLDLFDMILVMTVEPGFGGQKFMADMMPKVKQLREAIDHQPGKIALEVDGGINLSTIEQAAEAGADVFVAGSAVYNGNPENSIAQLRELLS
ncbi:MAG: ribulose-phosphate 3-epimerase [Micrococcaceae bacterium]